MASEMCALKPWSDSLTRNLLEGFGRGKVICHFLHLSIIQWHRYKYTDQEMIPARNVVTLAKVMFVNIQRENILPSKITIN
jgi:hypothetical protein